jgi:hypothetical protein
VECTLANYYLQAWSKFAKLERNLTKEIDKSQSILEPSIAQLVLGVLELLWKEGFFHHCIYVGCYK